MLDLGFTHVALCARDLAASVVFYRRFAGLEPVHARAAAEAPPGAPPEVVWLADAARRFVLVLVQRPDAAPALTGLAHLGVACASRDEVDARIARARAEGHAVRDPVESGPPVGYWGFITDPDGNNLELSFGQEIGLTLSTEG